MTFISYAQNFEDVLLWRAFGHLDHGFYIDVGAAHPDIDSVTRAFYDRGWTGINIEPVPEYVARLKAARPRDVTLCAALGAAAGEGTVYVVAGTGLSTTDAALAEQHRDNGWDIRAQDVPAETLAEVCRLHAPATIHFLKIDVEGAEAAVLRGADFTRYRPQIVLVEATAPGTTVSTHENWETPLLAAGYRFLWFDGLNRFYAAAEHHDALAVHFRVPVCVFDDFLRAADTEWTRRISHAETRIVQAHAQSADLLEQAMVADAVRQIAEARARESGQRAQDAEQRAQHFEQRVQGSEQRAASAEELARLFRQREQAADQRAQAQEARAAAAEHLVRHNEAQAAAEFARLHAVLRRLQAEEAALRASTSWRLTAPLRNAVVAARGLAGARVSAPTPVVILSSPPPAPAAQAIMAHEPGTPLGPSPTATLRSSAPTRTVHQFHSGSAVNDAVTNALLLIRTQLRALGYDSEIFVEHRDPLLESELRLVAELPGHDGYVLILHHSMGFDAYDRILALPAPKILMYHNITPPALFDGHPYIQQYARLGREQLAGLRGHVVSALADSEYNAIELRKLDLPDVAACTLLFDLAALRARAPSGRSSNTGRSFTVLFVGRIVASKGQRDLLEAFAVFRKRYARPSQLVLVGRGDGVGQTYLDEITARIDELGLASAVSLPGLVSDDELRARLSEADLYVSLSRHEGFGVPLVEAAAFGIPVLAWPAGAVAYTLGGEAGLLTTRDPDGVARRIAELAADPESRLALARAQAQSINRLALAEQLPRLILALVRAGAAVPDNPEVAAILADGARYTIAGHVNKTYSLAAITRTLARMLDRAHPGRVRLEPVEGDPTSDLSEVPALERAGIADLAARPPHETGPVVVISQHYPVHVPQDRGDVLLAMVFWEESLLPSTTVAVLNRSFDAVLAPSRFVAKALVDSGVSIPVHTTGYAPELAPFLALPGPRPDRLGPFTFLHVSSAFPRKGIDILLAAFVRAFRDTDAVRLILKTFPNPHNDAAAQIAALQRADPHAPKIILIDRDLDQDALTALYRDADTVVLPTRGEGFNLPAAEAMAAGVPLIVTGAGGHMDFCDPDTARLLRYRCALSLSHVAAPMSAWFEPDADDLAAALREAVADRRPGMDRAARARRTIAGRLAPENRVTAIGRAAIDTLLYRPMTSLRMCVVTSWNVRCGVAGYARFLVDAMRMADPNTAITVLSDMRPPDSTVGDVPVEQAWQLGLDDSSALLLALARNDPHIVLIQHQPGLLGWAALGRLLTDAARPRRAVVVTLHNTMNLLEVDRNDRGIAVSGLQAASRVIVHNLTDIERLNGLGLSDNVVLVPHGAPAPLPGPPARVLKPGKPVVIGCCGFLLPDKGLPTLVEALAILRATWRGARLKLYNASYGHPISDEEAERVRTAIEEASLGDTVELVTDYLTFDDARTRLASCDIIVLPYPHSKEAASGALHMALGAGPCVAVTPIALFEEAGDAVYRLPGTGAAGIARGMAVLLDDQATRAKVADNAREWMNARAWPIVGARVAGMARGLHAGLHEAAP